jgi:colanic acid/amylovoran biosynthesis protein
MYTQSLGPFSSRYHTRQVRFIAKRARAIFLRDQRSLQHLVDIGADISAASVVPDVAFALAAPAGGSRTGAVRKAVVSVRRWGSEESMDRYRGAVAQTISALVTAGFHVVLASSCQGIPEYVDDSQTSERIADTLSDDVRQAVTVDRSQRGPQELMTLLAEADIALCTRMHMAILSLNVGTPVVAIAYEFKTRELFESLGIAARVVDFETVTGDQLCRAVMDAIADPTLPPEVEDMKAGARATAGLLRRALEPSAA